MSKGTGSQFRIRSSLSPRSDLMIGSLGVAVLIVVWCLLTYSGYVAPSFLPSPTGIWNDLAEANRKGWLLTSIGRSLWRITKALIAVISIGVPLGILVGAFAPADALLRKLVNGAKAVPIPAISGLIVLWFGFTEGGKIFYLFLGAVFYMMVLVKNAVASVNEEYLRVALDLGANRWQIIRRVLLPGALPQIWDAIAVCNSIMWTYIVLAEGINLNATDENLGLGVLLFGGSRVGKSGMVFGMLIIIAILSSLTDVLLQSVRKRWLDW